MLGFKGPRKMTVLIPGMTHDQKRVQIIPQDNSDSILGNSKHTLRILPLAHRYRSLIIKYFYSAITRSGGCLVEFVFPPFLYNLSLACLSDFVNQ